MDINQHFNDLVNNLLPNAHQQLLNADVIHSEETINKAIKQLSRIKFEIKKIQMLEKERIV